MHACAPLSPGQTRPGHFTPGHIVSESARAPSPLKLTNSHELGRNRGSQTLDLLKRRALSHRHKRIDHAAPSHCHLANLGVLRLRLRRRRRPAAVRHERRLWLRPLLSRLRRGHSLCARLQPESVQSGLLSGGLRRRRPVAVLRAGAQRVRIERTIGNQNAAKCMQFNGAIKLDVLCS